MKYLFLITSLVLIGCNTQTKSSEGYKSIRVNNLHNLPTETEWIAAGQTKNSKSKCNPARLVYSVNDLPSLPTEAVWKEAATLDKRSDAK